MEIKMFKVDEEYMRLAVKEAKKNLKKMDGGPFGACVVKGNKVLVSARNTVLKNDASCHAEINAIRTASKKLGSFDLSGSSIYSTTEPCPMCFSAIHWARIDAIIYGTRIADAKKAGFNELVITNSRMKALGKSKIKIFDGFLYDECKELFEEWSKVENRRYY